MLRIVYKDYKSSFAELLSEDKSLTVYHRNVQKLAIEMYQVTDELCLKVMYRNHYPPWSKNLVNYSRRNNRICIIRNIPSKNKVMETK